MTPDSLKLYLRRHSQGETRNFLGNPYTFDYKEAMVTPYGEKYIIFPTIPPPQISNSGGLVVQKNSRFQTVPLHAHTWVELNYMYSGSCSQYINQETTLLKQNQISLIDSNTPHALGYAGEDDIMINILISKSYLDMNFFHRLSAKSFVSKFFIDAISSHAHHNNYIIFSSEKSRRIPIFIQEFLCEYYDPSINSKDILDSLMVLIISELIHVFEKEMQTTHQHSAGNSVIPILRYLENHFKTCSLEKTAQFFCMNPNYLTTLLKQQTGMSYKELILAHKIDSAAHLLKMTDWSVTEVAHEVGYENVSFFYKKFRAKYGVSPKEYRG